MADNPYATPQSALADSNEGQAWRQNRDVVIRREGGELPNCCIKCNGAVAVRKTTRLSYLNPWFYLLFFINILVLLIVGLIFQKSARVDIPLCDMHHRRNRRFVLVMWGLFWAAVLGMMAAGAAQKGELIGVILVLLLVLAIVAIGGRLVYARKIDKEFVWIRGAGPDYLARLPEFRG